MILLASIMYPTIFYHKKRIESQWEWSVNKLQERLVTPMFMLESPVCKN